MLFQKGLALDRLAVRHDWQALGALGTVIRVRRERAPHKHGISYKNGWTHIDGWSERIVDYIAAVEAEAAA